MIDPRIIGFTIFLLIVMIIIITQVWRSQKNIIPNDEESIRRTQTLANVLQGLYGDWWPVIMIILFVLNLIILGLLYYLSFHTQYTVSDSQYKWIQRMTWIWIVIVLIGLSTFILITGNPNADVLI